MSQYRHRRTSDPAVPFPVLEPGEIAVNTANRQLAVGDAQSGVVGVPLAVIAVRFFDARAKYAVGDYVINPADANLYRAKIAVGPATFNPAQWDLLTSKAESAYLLVDGTRPMTGNLTLANSTPPTALVAASKGYVDTQDALNVAKAGSTMTGPLVLSADPAVPLGAATKQYADAMLPKAGGTMTGAIILPGAEPSAPQAATPKVYVDGAIASAGSSLPAVRYDAAQVLTAAQQVQARQNIYAAPFDALAYGGLQVNGSFDISQAFGTAAQNLVNNQYLCIPDTWYGMYQHASATFQAYQFGGTGFPGLQNCFRLAATTGGNIGAVASDFARMFSPVEGYRIARLGWGTASAQPLTIGLLISASVPGKLAVSLNNADGSRSYVTTVTLNSGNAWEYKTITIPGCTDGVWKTDNSIGLVVGVASLCGSGYQGVAGVWGTGVHLCTSDTTNFFATTNNLLALGALGMWPGNEAPSLGRLPFVFRTTEQEGLLCSRYYEPRYHDASGTDINCWFQAASLYDFLWSYKVNKRATPTITKPSTSNWLSSTPSITASYDHALFTGPAPFAVGGPGGSVSLVSDARMY